MNKHLNYSIFIFLLFCSFGLKAQNHKTFSAYKGEKEITAPLSVTLTDGFYAATGSMKRFKPPFF